MYGARPLKRAIQQHLIQPLAMQLLRGDLADGDTIVADAKDGKLEFRREKKKAVRVPEEVARQRRPAPGRRPGAADP